LCHTGIMKRLSNDKQTQQLIFAYNIHKTLVVLLSSNDSYILYAVLVTLVNLCNSWYILLFWWDIFDRGHHIHHGFVSLYSPKFVDKVHEYQLCEPLLDIIRQNQAIVYKGLASELLEALVECEHCRHEIQLYQGIVTFFGYYSFNSYSYCCLY